MYKLNLELSQVTLAYMGSSFSKKKKRKDIFFSFSEKDTWVAKRKKETIPDSPAISKTNFLSEPIRAGKQAAVCLAGPAHL